VIEARRARPLLGTRVEVVARGSHRDALLAAAGAALDEVAAMHRLLSFHDPESDLGRLHRAAHREAVKVDRRTWRALASARWLTTATSGGFDPTCAASLVAGGLRPRPTGAPEPDPGATLADLVLLPGWRVRFRRPLWIDLGGIAKGLAVDRAVARLRALGIPAGSVEAGGDLRVFGAGAVRVAIRDPREPGAICAVIELEDSAVASSSQAAEPGHLVATGFGAVSALGASVVAARCTVADAWTKGALFAPEAARRALPGIGAAALVVDSEGPRWLCAPGAGKAAA